MLPRALRLRATVLLALLAVPDLPALPALPALPFALLAVLVLAACSPSAPPSGGPGSTPSGTTPTEDIGGSAGGAQTSPTADSAAKAANPIEATLGEYFGAQQAFAAGAPVYVPVEFTPTMVEAPGTPADAANLDLVLAALRIDLSAAQRAFLEANRFLLLDGLPGPEGFCFGPGLETEGEACNSLPIASPDEMVALFEQFGGSAMADRRHQANAIYVDPDIVLHTYHVFIDRYFKRLESRVLYPRLQSIVDRLQSAAFAAKVEAKSPDARASLERVAAFLTLGRVLLETTSPEQPTYFESPEQETAWREQDHAIDADAAAFETRLARYRDQLEPETYDAIRAEIPLIVTADRPDRSPLFAVYDPLKPVDYTQFTPRSHYRETSRLRAYFRAMMLFGRQTMPFGSREGLQDAATLTALIAQSGAEEDWTALSDTTDFFAGKADDITYEAFRPALGDLATLTPDALLDDANTARILAAAAAMPAPRILSDIVIDTDIAALTKEDLLLRTKGFRLFGQKFTFDAWVLNRMTAGAEKTEVSLPSTPTALFVASALGSELADEQLPEWVSRADRSGLDAAALGEELAGIRADIDAVTPAEWLTSIGSAWLWALQPLLQVYGDGYPAFMQVEPYRRKNLQTALGSYAELKHDTLLYAKQSYTELGAGGPEEREVPPIVRGFVEPDLEFWARLIALADLTRAGLAERDLLEEEVGGRFDAFLEALRFYVDIAEKEVANEPIGDDDYEALRTSFWKVSRLIAPFGGEEITPDDQKSPLIADVHTDALKGQILYEATGKPLVMLAFVADQGTPRIVVGVAYRHYEFSAPLAARLTDQDWRARLDAGDPPETPFWVQSLFVR